MYLQAMLLRKMARELGLEVKDGVVCGIFKRYAVSMWRVLITKPSVFQQSLMMSYVKSWKRIGKSRIISG